jgi:hypothetical protein
MSSPKANQRRRRGRRSGDLLKAELPLYVAYLILFIRLLALLTVQLRLDPAHPSGPVARIERHAAAVSVGTVYVVG